MRHHFESESNASLTPKGFARKTGSSQEICDSLERYAGILQKWQKRFNLVGKSTLNDLWRRHFLDSAQLLPLISQRQGALVDLGSGAGFPALVLSIMGKGGVHLIESDANKTEFMRQVIRETQVDAVLHRCRIEHYDGPRATTVTSRACAPVSRLLDYAASVCSTDVKLLFLKGKNWQTELTESQEKWHIHYQTHVSCTDPNGVILEINEFNPR